MNRLQQVASYIATAPVESIPAEAFGLAKMALIDFIASAVAGADEEVSQIVARHLPDARDGGAATVIGHAIHSTPADAAFANGTTAHALDFDDSNMALGGHPSVVLFPAALALGEVGNNSGRSILDAYVIGFEVLTAMARAVNFEHYEKGWHPTATLGVFGATAAAARLLRLDAEKSAAALGLAASMSSGVKANFGSMAKPLQVGEASRRGVACALLASDGCTASSEAWEGEQGFLNVYNGVGNYRSEELGRLGQGFEILRSGFRFKKYACCGSTHAPIDAALTLRRQYGLKPADIAGVTVSLNARRRPHVDRPVVDSELAGKFSVQYTVAAALADGEVRLRHFTRAAIRRPDLQDLTKQIALANIASQGNALAQQCEIVIETKDGRNVSLRLEDAEGRGAEEYAGYMKQKFSDCMERQHGAAEMEALYQALMHVEELSTIKSLLRRLGGKRAHETLEAAS